MSSGEIIITKLEISTRWQFMLCHTPDMALAKSIVQTLKLFLTWDFNTSGLWRFEVVFRSSNKIARTSREVGTLLQMIVVPLSCWFCLFVCCVNWVSFLEQLNENWEKWLGCGHWTYIGAWSRKKLLTEPAIFSFWSAAAPRQLWPRPRPD